MSAPRYIHIPSSNIYKAKQHLNHRLGVTFQPASGSSLQDPHEIHIRFMNTWIDPDDFFLEVYRQKTTKSGDLQHSRRSCIASLQEKSNNTGITYFPLCIHVLLIINKCVITAINTFRDTATESSHACV